MNDVATESIIKELDRSDSHAYDIDEALTDILKRLERVERATWG